MQFNNGKNLKDQLYSSELLNPASNVGIILQKQNEVHIKGNFRANVRMSYLRRAALHV